MTAVVRRSTRHLSPFRGGTGIGTFLDDTRCNERPMSTWRLIRPLGCLRSAAIPDGPGSLENAKPGHFIVLYSRNNTERDFTDDRFRPDLPVGDWRT